MLEVRFVSFKDQDIYNNQRNFRRAIKLLMLKDLAGYRIFNKEQYFLKREGVKFARILKKYAN